MDTKSIRRGYQIFAGYQIKKVDTKQAAWIPNWGLFGILGCHLATLVPVTFIHTISHIQCGIFFYEKSLSKLPDENLKNPKLIAKLPPKTIFYLSKIGLKIRDNALKVKYFKLIHNPKRKTNNFKLIINLGANDWDLLTILSQKNTANILLYIFLLRRFAKGC